MNCREFRRKHDAYVDNTLSGMELETMGLHLRLCQPCSKLDTRVRRALFLAHNLPMIQPSAQFSARLAVRLHAERHLIGTAGREPARARPLATGTYAVLAASLLLAAGVAMSAAGFGGREQMIRHAPVVATLPESEPADFASAAMVASMPAGISVWPAVFVAQQATWQFASETDGR